MRRNTTEGPKTYTVDSLLDFVAEKFPGHKGAAAFTRYCRKTPAFAQQAVTIINAALAKKHAAKAQAEAAAKAAEAEAAAKAAAAKADVAPAKPSGGSVSAAPGSDAEMWLALADLVDSALPELSSEEREALKAAFRAEAK